MPPPWRWAAVSAGVLAVFALVAIVVSHSGLARTALILMTKASELPVGMHAGQMHSCLDSLCVP